MKLTSILLTVAVIFSLAAVLPAQADRERTVIDELFSITGKVISIQDSGKMLEIRDDAYQDYRVLAKDAEYYEGDRERSLRDIDEGDEVRVYGRERADRSIDANAIYRFEKDYERYARDANSVRLHGAVVKIDKKYRNLTLDIDGGKQKVLIDRDTRVFAGDGRRVGVDYLKAGDAVRVDGYRAHGNDIRADRISVEGSVRWNSKPRTESVRLRVERTTTLFSRDLRVRPEDGRRNRLPEAFDLRAPKDAKIERGGRSISVHDIRRGEILLVELYREGSSYVAGSIRVDQSRERLDRNYPTASGRVEDIDYGHREFVLVTGGGERRVYADRARVSMDGKLLRFQNLRARDHVIVRGEMDGRKIDAESIEIMTVRLYTGGRLGR